MSDNILGGSVNTEFSAIRANIKSEIDDLIFDIYDLNDEERETIEYTINCTLPIARKKKLPLANDEDMRVYCDVVEKYFNELLFNKGIKVVSHIQKSLFFYKVVFELTDKNSADSQLITNSPPIIELLNLLSKESYNSSLLINKKVKGFYKNAFYISKTKDLYNWTKFNAVLDINDFVEDVFSNEDVEDTL